ncbi:F-box/kelch-repeat protein At3g23880-like [Lolium rigidum]|uniref:F-box/kelch-repeat protein At3g23880-like n=1 Tax=Lolium rigidum TaxID=89674 RepID=UPI001F5E318C|nr:F-box/kelch-repeat protein At3g23880-like [Lolium rigidum]
MAASSSTSPALGADANDPATRAATLLEDLPQEIIDKILVQLPSKDIGRFRAVCTSWGSATSTPEFMLEHHRRQPSLPIINGNGRPASLVVLRDTSARASNQHLWPFRPGFKHRSEYRLLGSCDGFLVVCRRSQFGSRFYAYNPVIRKHALLAQPQVGQSFYNTMIGFYRHHPTGEYRVLWVSRSHHSWSHHLCKPGLYILTVGSDRPRYVGFRTTKDLPPSEHIMFLQRLCCSSYYSPPVHHRGSLHWCSYGTSDIIVFDTQAESFRWMQSPTELWPSKLFDMKGMLALWAGSARYYNGFTIMDVWVMRDYEAEIWDFMYRIDLSTVEASRQLYSTSFYKRNKRKFKKKKLLHSPVRLFEDMAVLNNRELLIMYNENHVLRCNIDGKFLGIVNLGKGQYYMWLTQHRLQESIVPIPYHETQEEDEESVFSTGCV